MRWQRIARWAIAIFVLAFAGVVYVALRRPPAPTVTPQTPRVDPKTIAELGPLTQRRTNNEGKIIFEINARGQLTYPDGRSVLTDAELTLPDADGGTFKVQGGRMEVRLPQNSDKPIETVNITHGAKLLASDGLEITSDQAQYDERTGVVTIPGEVQFKRGRLSGTGVGATYDKGRNVVWLLDKARIHVVPDEKGQGAVEATARAAGLARNEHYLRLTGSAHVVGEGRVLDADELTVQLTPDDKLIQTMALRGNSRITGTTGAAGAEGMAARDIDLTYGADGRTLQQARLSDNAGLRLAAGRSVSARQIDLTMGPDGSTLTSLDATQNVQLDLPAEGAVPARRINSATLNAGGPNGLETATFAGGVSYREIRPPRRGGPAAADRTARAQRLVVQTQPGLGAVQQADFRGAVHISDGDTTADAPRAIHHVAQDAFDLMLSPGDPGPTPTVNDGRVLVHARTINFTIGSKKLKADTEVRSSLQSARSEAAKGTAGTAGRGRGAAPETGKLPAMLKQDQPVNVTAAKLDYDGASGVATYTGDARLFQDQTQIQGDTIIVDDRSGNLTSRGHVRTVMFFDEVDSKTKARQPVQTIATSELFVYQDEKRIATYTAGPSARAHMVGSQGDVTANEITLFIKPKVNELERAEADGAVTVKEGARTATGDHLVYTPSNETYVMSGSPVEIEEKTPTACRVSSGTTLTFQRAANSMVLDNNGAAPVKLRPCTAK